MADIKNIVKQIRNAIYGVEVRDSIAEGIEELNNKIDSFPSDVIGGNLIADTWYKPPVIGSCELGDDGIPSVCNENNYEDFLEWKLNKLLKKYPDYISKKSIGKDQSGNYYIYSYTFTPKKYDKTMLILSGCHGNEKTAFFGMCKFIEQLCENSSNDGILNYIKEKVKIVYVPVVNPYGFSRNIRHNVNGVDLNKNTSYMWNEYTSENASQGKVYYKGIDKFSEAEAKAIRDLMQNLADTEDNFTSMIDLHTLQSIDATKVIYYPRFFDNDVEGLSKIVNTFNTGKENQNKIFSTSNVPTFSNYGSFTHGLMACNPEWNDIVYGPQENKNSENMTKYVEWIGNIIYCYAKHDRKRNVSITGPSSQSILWNGNFNIKKSETDTPNSIEFTKTEFTLDRPYNVDVRGTVKLNVIEDCEVELFPLLYTKNANGQSYTTVYNERRFSQVINLKAGEHIIPLNAVCRGFFDNYNTQDSSRSDYVHFRLCARTNILNSAKITDMRFFIDFVPTDKGIPLEIYQIDDLGNKDFKFPQRIPVDLLD